MTKYPIQPRFLRAHQAPGYLGMCREIFNKTVRPYVHEFPIGQQGIGFDRIELDQWADAYKAAFSVSKQTPPPPEIGNQKSSSTKRGHAGFRESASAHRRRTIDEFHRVLECIQGKPATTNDRKHTLTKKQQPSVTELLPPSTMAHTKHSYDTHH